MFVMENEKKGKVVAWAIAFSNIEKARRLFKEEFNEEAPSNHTVKRWVDRLLVHGDINMRQPGSGPPVTASGDGTRSTVRQRVKEEPTVSTRQLSQEIGVSQSSIVRILHEEGLHPYKFQLVHGLSEDDYDRRMEFCEWILDKTRSTTDFHNRILFSDEAVFHVAGVVNRHNLHYWAPENPHATLEKSNNRESVTVWCMLSVEGVEAFDINFATMNGERYCQILEEKVLPFFSQARNRSKLYQHDGAPPHYSIKARQLLDAHLPKRWIGRRGPIEWPPRSPDLTVCDFFLWGVLREKVYAHQPKSRHQLARIIEEELSTLDSPMFARAYESFMQRCGLCYDLDGRQFESHLQ